MPECVAIPHFQNEDLLIECLDKIRFQNPNIQIFVFRLSPDTKISCTHQEKYTSVNIPDHKYYGKNYLIMESLRVCYEIGFDKVFLIEDNVMVEDGFFEFHLMNNTDDDFAYCGYKFSDEGCEIDYNIPLAWFSAVGASFGRKSLEKIVKHAIPEFYADQFAYMKREFPDSHYVKFDDILLKIMEHSKQMCIWGSKPKCSIRKSLVFNYVDDRGFMTVVPARRLLNPKILIAVVGCHKRYHNTLLQRKHWAKRITNSLRDERGNRVKVDIRFFFGENTSSGWVLPNPQDDFITRFVNASAGLPPLFGAQYQEGDVFLSVKDDYESLPLKVKAICQYALNNGYDYVFKTDDDVYVKIQDLLSSGYENYDYSGRYNNHGWAMGGPGYWLSRYAMKLVADAPYNQDWAEDRYVGRIMIDNYICCYDEKRYQVQPIRPQDKWITACSVEEDIEKDFVSLEEVSCDQIGSR